MKDTKKHVAGGMFIMIAIVIVAYLGMNIFISPRNFPVGKNFVINENESLRSVSGRLGQEGYISSPILFRAGVSYFNKDTAIQIGEYVFPEPLTLLEMVHTFVEGRPKLPLLSVTIPEGSTSNEVALIVRKVLPSVSIDAFTTLVATYNADGRLYPSTYFILPSYTAEDIVKLMVTTFTKKVENYILSSKVVPPLTNGNEVVILASILEGEANNAEDMKIVAGILLKRMSIGMPLQVDVAMETYKEKGLPKAPINNPGLIAINAVLNPTKTDYLYYITGNDGLMYYAKTFDEHKKNIKKYLK